MEWRGVCIVGHDCKPCKTDEPMEHLFEERLACAKTTCIRWKCTLAPPNEYDGLICVATMMRSVATVAVAIGLVYITGHVRQGRSTLSRRGSLSKKIVVDRLTRPVIQCIGELASAISHIAHTGVIIVSGIIASCLCIDVIRSPRFAFKLVQGLVVERRYTAHRCCCVNHSTKSQLKRKHRLPEYRSPRFVNWTKWSLVKWEMRV